MLLRGANEALIVRLFDFFLLHFSNLIFSSLHLFKFFYHLPFYIHIYFGDYFFCPVWVCAQCVADVSGPCDTDPSMGRSPGALQGAAPRVQGLICFLCWSPGIAHAQLCSWCSRPRASSNPLYCGPDQKTLCFPVFGAQQWSTQAAGALATVLGYCTEILLLLLLLLLHRATTISTATAPGYYFTTSTATATVPGYYSYYFYCYCTGFYSYYFYCYCYCTGLLLLILLLLLHCTMLDQGSPCFGHLAKSPFLVNVMVLAK